MGLNTIKDLLEKRGEEAVYKFLNEEVVITEKLDTFRILFERQGETIKFFKKDNTEINLVERTLTDIWENALVEIPTLLDGIEIPEGLRFGIAYTPVERPIRLPYSHLPTYILTDITRRSGNKVTEVLEYKDVKEWSKTFEFGQPPVIFEGKLSERQQDKLIEYGTKHYNDLDSFTDMLVSEFGTTASGENIVEGVIIKSKDKVAQILSYEFEILSEAYNKSFSGTRDFYDLTLLSINTFMDKYSIPVLESDSKDRAYINIINDIFNNYCRTNTVSETLEPKFLTPPRFGHSGSLNKRLIDNDETLEILQKGEIYEALYRVMLSSFRRYKKEYGLISESDANKFNTFVFLINEQVDSLEEIHGDKPLLEKEPQLLTEQRSENIVVQTFTKKKASDIDNMRVIASIQKAFSPEAFKVKKGNQPCAVYFTDANPFTKKQEENLHAIYRQWKIPVIIGTMINPRRVEGEKFKFSDALIKAQMDSIAIFNKDIVPNYFLLDGWDLNGIFEFLRPKYEPKVIITDTGMKADFVIQLYFEDEVMGGRINADPEFNIGEMEVPDKVMANRYLEENLFSFFKDYTPQPIWGLWDSMRTEYQVFTGELKV